MIYSKGWIVYELDNKWEKKCDSQQLIKAGSREEEKLDKVWSRNAYDDYNETRSYTSDKKTERRAKVTDGLAKDCIEV